MTVLIPYRGIGLFAAGWFRIHEDVVDGQMVLQRELVFSWSQNILMLSRCKVLDRQKSGDNKQYPAKDDSQKDPELDFLFSTPHGRWFLRRNFCADLYCKSW